MQTPRRPRGFVVADPSPEELGSAIDWSSWYLTDEDDRSRTPEIEAAAEVAFSSLIELVRARAAGADRVGRDELFAWVPGQPLVRVSPDAFVMPAPEMEPPHAWETWRPGHRPPRFALEIVAEDWTRDYADDPAKHWQLGVRELAIFDPAAISRAPRAGGRVPLQLYRRDEDGAFVRVHAGSGPAHSRELDTWLVVRGEGASARLRLARDPSGTDLVPTGPEAQLLAEEARARAERELGRMGEAMARSAAEREIARLREELAHERRAHEAARTREEAQRAETAREMARLREELAQRRREGY